MATIANQIQRIQGATGILRDKGLQFGLYVPEGQYWDNNSKQFVTSAASILTSSDQIDKIAAAFGSINVYNESEISVPILITKNGNAVISETTKLNPGYYKQNAVIKPFITLEDSEDYVLDIQTIIGKKLTSKTGTITPANGYNYIDSLSYEVQDGEISNEPVKYDNNGVTVKVKTSGWLEENSIQVVTVDTSTMKSTLGETEKTLTHGDQVIPSSLGDTTITISKGIYGSDRTLIIPSVSSQTQGTAEASDILDGKIAYVNGVKVTGTMSNYSGTLLNTTEYVKQDNKLAIKPSAAGYYDTNSVISTDIAYDPTRVFNITTIDNVDGTDVMSAQTYYETIPAGYYSQEIKRAIRVKDVSGKVEIDYDTHKATFKVESAGWIAEDVTIDINAGTAYYKQDETDLTSTQHVFTVTPEKDQDGAKHSYLTAITIDNSVIFEALAAI